MQHQENVTPDLPDAACKGLDVEAFYLYGDRTPPDPVQLWMLRKLCAHCPEQEPCLTYAMKSEAHGLWGGLTEHERFAFGGRKTQMPKRELARIRLVTLHHWGQVGGDVNRLKTLLRRWFR